MRAEKYYIVNADLNTKPVKDWNQADFDRANKEYTAFDNARRKREGIAIRQVRPPRRRFNV